MMLVYLVRQFTFDQINHIAKNKNPKRFVELRYKFAKTWELVIQLDLVWHHL